MYAIELYIHYRAIRTICIIRIGYYIKNPWLGLTALDMVTTIGPRYMNREHRRMPHQNSVLVCLWTQESNSWVGDFNVSKPIVYLYLHELCVLITSHLSHHISWPTGQALHSSAYCVLWQRDAILWVTVLAGVIRGHSWVWFACCWTAAWRRSPVPGAGENVHLTIVSTAVAAGCMIQNMCFEAADPVKVDKQTEATDEATDDWPPQNRFAVCYFSEELIPGNTKQQPPSSTNPCSVLCTRSPLGLNSLEIFQLKSLLNDVSIYYSLNITHMAFLGRLLASNVFEFSQKSLLFCLILYLIPLVLFWPHQWLQCTGPLHWTGLLNIIER